MNIAIAHFREGMASGLSQDEAARLAVRVLLSAPTDLISWLLFVMGVGFFWISCFDGFQLRDPYPSYSREYSRLVDAKEAYADAVSEMHEAMANVRDTYIRRIGEIAKQRDLYAHHVTSLHDRIERISTSYLRHCEFVRRSHRSLIEEYRDGNRRARSSAPPLYFGLVDDLSAIPVPTYTAPGTISEAGGAAARAVSAITEAHDQELRQLTTVAQLGDSAGVDKTLA